MMNHLERFLAVMEYHPVDRVPNWEAGVWPQVVARWEAEGLNGTDMHWNWFPGEESIGLDPREFIYFNHNLMPGFEREILKETDRSITFKDEQGRTRKALKAGSVGDARMSMDQYIDFPVHNEAEWQAVKKRLDPRDQKRYEPYWHVFRVDGWRNRRHPLVFAPNTSTAGFYWQARELMGTEGLSYAWYDQPNLVHDIMEHVADFLIEAARPVLAKTTVEYICLAEDLAMKTGPLLSPKTYRTFIYPRLKQVIDFFKSHGVRYICVDTDGNPEKLIPMMLDAGVDALWPLERTADQDPIRLRQKYGRSLRLWGGVDKRVLTQGPEAIDAHLRTLQPLIEEGGFIPTVDHTVPPDVSWANFQHYLTSKAKLLRGQL
ncbi:uroporphyrinogen decarboxylase family protein [Candidatus Leptofilum sp.]|uniref:uroporphyrinogen decarboxylase family protein n=1 Tax=Candidatus Leptofilum sp. TaxID=3241576 RepID=UPI003B5A9089